MARPKIFNGSTVGLRLPKDIDLCLRAAAVESGRSISELVRETLSQSWGKEKKNQEARNEQ
jgi:hypothetical protein